MPAALRILLVSIAAIGLAIWGVSTLSGPDIPRPPEIDRLDPMVRQAVDRAVLRVRNEPRSSAAWTSLGSVFYANEMQSTGAACFERALVHDPDDCVALYLLGRHEVMNGDGARAIPRFRRILDLRPNHTITLWHLTEALLDHGNAAEAHARLQKAFDADPANTAIAIALARAETALGRTDEAIALLRPIAASPGIARGVASRFLGQAYRYAGEAEAARSAEASALPETPWPDPWYRDMQAHRTGFAALRLAAEHAVRTRDWASAERALDVLLSRTPDDASLLNMRGVAHFELGQGEQAIAVLRRAVELAPAQSETRLNLSRVLEQHDGRDPTHLAEAERVLAPLLVDGATLPEALFRLASVQQAAGRLDDAIATTRRLHALGVRPVDASLLKAALEHDAGRPGDALATLVSLTEAVPTDPRGFAALALAAARAGDRPRALASVDRAQALHLPDVAGLRAEVLSLLERSPPR
ncbi:MAG: tetratricopeptide repeat protein [Phycisphaeraceae bacterium]|nr:tetratricopeptide repeat protein [Phycisphaeraceae bacterium]